MPPLASLDLDVALITWFVVAEALVFFCQRAAVALELYSRSGLLVRARDAEAEAKLDARLEHVGAYEIAVRLLRFLANTMLVVGIAILFLGDAISSSETASVPWDRVVLVVVVAFLVTFVINDVLLGLASRRRPTRFLWRALPALEVLRVVTWPLRLPLMVIARLVFQTNLVEPEQTAREEVLESVEEGEREGSLTPDEADMIESIIDLDSATAEDVCTPRGEIAMVHEEESLDAAAKYMLEEGHRRIPVYGGDRDVVVGVIHALDLLEHTVRGTEAQAVGNVMREPFFVPEGKPLNDLLGEMRERRASLAVVLNEFGGTAGIVTMEDLLEEIVGDIEDEHDQLGPPPVTLHDGAYYVDGRASIEEVNAALSVKLPLHDDFETVGGLVFHRLGKVPKVGDRVTIDGVSLTVTEADERTVRRVRVRLVSDAS